MPVWHRPKHKVIGVVDGPDTDNYLALLALLSSEANFDLVAVVMTGRPVCMHADLPPHHFTPNASRAVRRDNALHAKGILMRHGGGHVPVYVGGIAPFTLVPHELHLRESVTDIWNDAHAGHELAGDMLDLIEYLARIATEESPIHIVCGGPLTDVATLMDSPLLHGKLGYLTAQLGMFNLGEGVQTIAGGRRQFNVLTDPGAARRVLLEYPNSSWMVPTDITKRPEFGFANVRQIAALSRSAAGKEVTAMYRQAWRHMWGPRGIPAHMHDFHPVEVMAGLLHDGFMPGAAQPLGRYTFSPVGIKHVPHLPGEQSRWGEIDLDKPSPHGPERYLIDSVDPSRRHHLRTLRNYLNGVPIGAHTMLPPIRG